MDKDRGVPLERRVVESISVSEFIYKSADECHGAVSKNRMSRIQLRGMQFLELSTRERAREFSAACMRARRHAAGRERKPPSPSALFVFDTVFIERRFTRQLRLHANGKPPTFLATM